MEIERVIKDSKNVSSPLLTPMPAPKETRCEVGVVPGCLDQAMLSGGPSGCHEVGEGEGEGGGLVEPA